MCGSTRSVQVRGERRNHRAAMIPRAETHSGTQLRPPQSGPPCTHRTLTADPWHGAAVTHLMERRFQPSLTLVGLASDTVTRQNLDLVFCSESCCSSPHRRPVLLSEGDSVTLGNDSGHQAGDGGAPFPPRSTPPQPSNLIHSRVTEAWEAGHCQAPSGSGQFMCSDAEH